MHKISVLITGEIKSSNAFLRSIQEFVALKNEGVVGEIILSTWKGELDKQSEELIEQVNENLIVVTPKPPKVNSGSIFYQMKSFHCALNKVTNKNNFIFKSRPDLFIAKEDLKRIFGKDYKINSARSPFKSKIWIPWFEISKPFYLADECFFCSYLDALKLYNYNTIYDNYYEIDAGISHIRRFYNPFIECYPEFEKFFQFFGVTGHGRRKRFEIFGELYRNSSYRKGMILYYEILKENFNIGLDKYGYIDFREWNKLEKSTLIESLYTSVSKKNSFDATKGHVYGYSDKDVITLLNFMPKCGDEEVITENNDVATKRFISQVVSSIPKDNIFKIKLKKLFSYFK
ncbi:hypothetical protein MUS1_03065 [Marinomonas ushuaiensis DSM 15871]|uniref:WavE lipopolysaccharide synthesis n=1 Tax=Marinomonas ushuaiensis DSM 15871 TaxID=1122207 RepID=X7E9D5_9GAMM|nr:hypothetical protein [Marinomonas ushuaiensis]ETX12709.1 hypothetical protein MUS1_03065 [Marinomonas ushuaiensis DSM 15871]